MANNNSHALGRENLYVSPIPEAMNVRFVENHITIDRSVHAVYDWVATWSNLLKWLPVARAVEVLKGRGDSPPLLGDELKQDMAARKDRRVKDGKSSEDTAL
jgi:hypothetical protein